MSDTAQIPAENFGPWNPGIKSDLPRDLLALATVYRPEYVSTPLREAQEFKSFCGLELMNWLRSGRNGSPSTKFSSG